MLVKLPLGKESASNKGLPTDRFFSKAICTLCNTFMFCCNHNQIMIVTDGFDTWKITGCLLQPPLVATRQEYSKVIWQWLRLSIPKYSPGEVTLNMLVFECEYHILIIKQQTYHYWIICFTTWRIRSEKYILQSHAFANLGEAWQPWDELSSV